MTDWGSARAVCPYYLGEQKNHISCEGLVKGTKLNVVFQSGDKKKSFKRDNCETFRGSCPIRELLEVKYR